MTPLFNRLIQRLRGGSDFEPSAPSCFPSSAEIGEALRDFTQSSSQRAQRPLKANSQAWICARMLMQGYEFTVQDVVKVLQQKNIVSNEPGRRIREAVAWLKNEGIRVSHYLEGEHPKHKRWYVAPVEGQKPEYLTVMRRLGLASH